MALDTFSTEPLDKPNDSEGPAIWDLVREDITARDTAGTIKYGQRLKPDDGRDPLIDLYQELLDSVVYCRKAIYEKYRK